MNEFEKARIKLEKRQAMRKRQEEARRERAETQQFEPSEEKPSRKAETIGISIQLQDKHIDLSYEIPNVCDGIAEHKRNEAAFNEIFHALLVSRFGAKVKCRPS